MPSLLTSPPDVLTHIAFHLGVLDPLGPPSDLLPLFLTCRHLYNNISVNNAPHLYRALFRATFDYRAPVRRLGPKAEHTSSVVCQFKKYCEALKVIRRGDISIPIQDMTEVFWDAFFMASENDGRNAEQLKWAGLRPFVDRFVRERLWEGREQTHGWPQESSVNALALWLMWFTMDGETLTGMTPEQREELKRLVRPYVITALRYPSSHAPDNHFDFPLSEEFEGVFPYTLITPHGYYPLYRDPEMLEEKFEHFGCELRIQAPLITQAAKLLYFACLETVSIPPPPGIPATRAHAVALNLPDGIPTTEDYEEMNAHKSAQLVDVGSWDWRAELNEEQGRLEDDGVWRKDLRSTSARWDNDWQRWCYCWDPWSDRDELKGVVYTYGTLSGLWQGRAMLPDIDGYFRLVQSQAFPNDFSASNPFLSVIPVYMNLREHHCINPEFPVGPGGSNDGFDEGLCNGWFPDQRLEESRDRGIVTCTDSSGNISRYETYSPTRRNSHHEDTCTTCLHRKADEEAALLRRIERRRRPEEQQRMVVAPQVQGIHEGEALRWTRLFPTQVNHDVNHDDPEPFAGPSNTAGNVVDEEAMDTAGSSSTPVESTDEVAQYHYEASNSLGGDVHDVIDTEMNAADGEGNAHLADNEHGGETMEFETIIPDQDAEYSDFIENHCTGIQDIIVTGETLHRHGQAWFHHRYYGRVRRYDGLIAIVRYEVHHPGQNVWIFRGYVTGDKNLVGSWRAWSNDVTVIPLEGPFVMSKVPTTQNPQ